MAVPHSSAPALATVPRSTRLRFGGALRDPLAILGAARERGVAGAGAAIFESSDEGLPTTRRSILIPRPLLRVEAREEHVRATPLAPEAGPLLEALLRRWSGARIEGSQVLAPFPASLADPALDDETRLRAPSVLDALRTVLGLVTDRPASSAAEAHAVLAPGLYGAFSFDLVDRFEDLPPRVHTESPDPDFSFALGLDAVVVDHELRMVEVTTRALPWERARDAEARHAALVAAVHAPLADEPLLPIAASPPACDRDLDDGALLARIAEILEAIRAGDLFQGVLSRRFEMQSAAAPRDVYRALRAANPSPYMFWIELGDGDLLGASPETFLRIEDREIEIRPIAGTAPRGRTVRGAIDPDLDARLALGLLLDPKEQAEHAMLLDLARNDVARIAAPGTCRVTQAFAVEKYSHVQHLVSRVRGTLRAGLDALHAYRAVANMGTLTGAPKLEATKRIRLAEASPRGFYGGAVGYLLQDGRADTCIGIRSLRRRGTNYQTRAGAGIVAQSVPARELAEIEAKSLACRLAVATAEAALPREPSLATHSTHSPRGGTP